MTYITLLALTVPVALTIAGMVGLYFKVEYSGWLLVVGLVSAIALL